MHNLRRLLGAIAIILTFSAISVFANGQGEASNLTGTVSSIQPTGTGNQVNIVLTTKSGSYTATVDQSVVSAASLAVGQTISLKGVLHKAADGSKSVDASQVEVDGHQYSVANTGTTSGNGTNFAKKVSDSPDHGQSSAHKAEAPEASSKKDSSKDKEKPEVKSPDKSGGKDS
jgi:hypothetical protein